MPFVDCPEVGLVYDSALGDQMKEPPNGQVFLQGIGIQKSENVNQSVLEIQGPVSGEEFLDVFDQREYFHVNDNDNTVNVYVDMSAGLRENITGSKHMEGLVSELPSDVNYYKVAGKIDDAPGYTPEDIPSFAGKVEDAMEYFGDPDNYVASCSKLKVALDSCVSNTEGISILITDFLNDDGVKRKLTDEYSSPANLFWTENSRPWAVDIFDKWFAGEHNLEIIAVKTSTKKDLYGCKGTDKSECDKWLYYMFFTPKHLVGKNADVLNAISALKDEGGCMYKEINPLAFYNQAVISKNELEFDYPFVSGYLDPYKSKNYNQIEFLPLHLPSLFKLYNEDDSLDILKDPIITNNFTFKRDTTFPFNTELGAKFYEITDVFYDLGSINKDYMKGEFNPNNYQSLIDSITFDTRGPRDKEESEGLFSFNTENYTVSADAEKVLQMQAGVGPGEGVVNGRLFLCDVILIDVEYKKMEDEMLQWIFYGKGTYKKNGKKGPYGSVNNTSLLESLNKSLNNQKRKYKNRVLYSYIIALNGNKQ
jgi:hypothetical protein